MGTVGDNIRKFRTFRGIKQQDLADTLDRTKSVISNWERGENSPDVEICEKLCKILKVTPNELFGWEPNRDYEQWVRERAKIESEIHDMQMQKAALEERIAAYAAKLAPLISEKEKDESKKTT
jgi:transcriptional regulator with XRE-family HTH domain